MKRILPLLVFFIIAIAVSFGVCRWSHCKRPQSMDALQDVTWMKKTLQLSDEQASEIQKLQANLKDRMEQCNSTHCAARCRLGTGIFEEDGTNHLALVEEMSQALLESEKATIEHIRQVHALLTPKQKEQYEELVATCVCDQCPHKEHK